MKAKDLILVALVCANVTLAAMAVPIYLSKAESEALAASQSRAGDYVMAAGPVTSNREGLLVIDVVAKRACLYVPKAAVTAGGRWELVATRNLAADFGAAP